MTRTKGAGPTISDVASEAKVARSTVSRAFSKPSMLSPSTVQKVQTVARDLGYVPNQVARALSTGRHRNIAVVVPDIGNPFFPPIIRGAQARAEEGGYAIFLADSDESAEREDVLIARLAIQAAGFVIASSRLADAQIRAHAGRRPLVLINRDIPRLPRVLIDATPGMTAAVDHLARLGHRRIGYISGPPGSWSNQQRRRAVRDSCRRLGLELAVIQAKAPTYEAGLNAAEAFRSTGSTAAIAFDDLTAQGLIAGLVGDGVRVPEDVSVIGCDDVLASRMYPQLTTVSGRIAEAGKIAVDVLLTMLDSEELRDIRYVIDTELVVRSTTAPRRQA